MTDIKELPKLYRTAVIDIDAVRAAAGDGDPRVPISMSSEYEVSRWFGREILDHSSNAIDRTYLDQGMAALVEHDTARHVGFVVSPSVGADRQLRGEVVFDSEDPESMRIYRKVAKGQLRFTSIGYRVDEIVLDRSDKQGDTYRVTRWTPMEVSFVAIPADPTVGANRIAGEAAYPVVVRSLASNTAPQGQETPMSDKDTAAQRGAATDVPVIDRSAEIVHMCALAGMPERIAEFVNSDDSLTDIRKAIFAARVAAAKVTPIAPPAVSGVHDRAEDKPWAGRGEFYTSVIRADRHPDRADVRLLASRAQDTGTGHEGGWAVPESIVQVLLEPSLTAGELLSRVTTRPITVGNGYKEAVVKEESRANGSRNGGVQGFWTAEDTTLAQSQAALRLIELAVKKVGVVVPITEEQMEDGPALESFINEQVPEELMFQKELSIWSGSGVGQPLGFTNSGALVTQAIEGTQTIANTNQFIWINAANMYARMPARMLAGAAFFINQELFAKILTSVTAAGAGAVPMFTMPGQLAAFPNGAIYGRPIVPVEYASAEGTVGDFVFANLRDYLFAQKGGVRFAQSMHVEFLRDRQVLKFIERVDGQPRTRVPMTPFRGTRTLSPYVALAARS